MVNSECGLRICATAKDGNQCFFTSVAVSFSQVEELGKEACTI